MPLITLDDVSLAFGHVALLDHAALVVEENERIGLIGRNGTGKSSLLKIIAGELNADDGRLWRRPELKLALVAQEPMIDLQATVFDAVAGGLHEQWALLHEYHELTRRMAQADADTEKLLDGMQQLQTRFERADAWNT